MTISTPPPYVNPPVAQEETPPVAAPEQQPLLTGAAGAEALRLESNSVDNSRQDNINNSSNRTVQVVNSFAPQHGEKIGDVVLNNNLEFYGQVTSDLNYHQFTAGIRGRLGRRGKTKRKLLKAKVEQARFDAIHRQQVITDARVQAQLSLETHCANLSLKGLTTATCKGLVVAIAPAETQEHDHTHEVTETPAPTPVESPVKDCDKESCQPVQGWW